MSTEMINPDTVRISEVGTEEILRLINNEDKKVPDIVAACIPDIAKLVEEGVKALSSGHRIIYCGAGTSGRLGVVDSAECPPTYGLDPSSFTAIIAGGPGAVFRAAEGCEDSREKGVEAFENAKCTAGDLVIGISVSGQAPFVCAFMEEAAKAGCTVGAIVNNADCPMSKLTELLVFADTGAEVVMGSTRMKGGSSQKMILNMFSTAVCIRMGYVYKNFMVNMQVSNSKLRRRAIFIMKNAVGVDEGNAVRLLENNAWYVRGAVEQAIREGL